LRTIRPTDSHFQRCYPGQSSSWGDAPGSPRRIRPVADWHEAARLALNAYNRERKSDLSILLPNIRGIFLDKIVVLD